MGATLRLRPRHGWTVRRRDREGRREVGGFGHEEAGRLEAQAWTQGLPAARCRRGPGWVVEWEGRDEETFGEGPDAARRAREVAQALRAELALAEEQQQELVRGPTARRVDRMVREWRRIHGPMRSERTRVTDQARVEHLARHFGARDAATLGVDDVTAFAGAMLETKSSHVAIGCLSILRRVLNLAAKHGTLPRNPVPEIAELIASCRERGRDEEGAPDAWSRAEVAVLLEVAEAKDPHLAPMLRVALGTGARRGELLALRWEDVDFARGRLAIRRTLRAGSQQTKAPKAGRHRFTPLAPSVRQALELVRGRQRRAVLEGTSEPDWVFASPKGQLWDEHNFARAWARVRRKAKEKGVRPLKFHSTRHTFISWALEAGTPAKIVSEWVGASVAVLERHYAHVLPRAASDLSFVEVGGHEVRAPGRSGGSASDREAVAEIRGEAAGRASDREGGG